MAKCKKRQRKNDNSSAEFRLSTVAEFGGVCEKLEKRFPGEIFFDVLAKLFEEHKESVMRVRLTLARTKSIREIFLPPTFPLALVAQCIETCFGFQDEHLYLFESDELGERPHEAFLDDELGNLFDNIENSLPLGFLLPQKGAKAAMKYDFGDGWEIKILRLADKTNKEEPTHLCFKSVGMDAIEDCGGPWRLMQFAEIYEKIVTSKKLTGEEKEQLEWCHGSTKLSVTRAKKLLAGPTLEEVSDRILEAMDRFGDSFFNSPK